MIRHRKVLLIASIPMVLGCNEAFGQSAAGASGSYTPGDPVPSNCFVSSTAPYTVSPTGQPVITRVYFLICSPVSTIAPAVTSATTQSTRTFTETLDDRNVSNAVGSGTDSSSAAPSSALQYAEPSSMEKTSPIRVKSAVGNPYRFFATTFGGGFDQSSGASSGNYFGGLIGIDYRIDNNFLVGIAGGASNSTVSLLGGSSGKVLGFNESAYIVATVGKFYAQSLTTISEFSNNTTRVVPATVATPYALEKSSYGSVEFRERFEWGRTVDLSGVISTLPKFKATPFVALEIARLHQDGHAEANVNGVGNASGVVIGGADIPDVPGFVGVRLEATYELGNAMTLTPTLRMAYVHQFAAGVNIMNVPEAGGVSTFASTGTLLGSNAAQTKAGFELSISKATTIFSNFDGFFSSSDRLYGGRGGVRVSF